MYSEGRGILKRCLSYKRTSQKIFEFLLNDSSAEIELPKFRSDRKRFCLNKGYPNSVSSK